MALLKPFEVFLVTFLTFLLYAALTEQQIVRDFARGLSYANFVKNDKSKLDTQQLASLRARTSAECKWKCLLNNNCFSLNYGGQGVGEKMCQLLTANKFESSTKMTIDENFQHFSVASPCDNKPCSNGTTCLPVYENNSYICATGKCAKQPCKNGGTCIGENLCKCPLPYSGEQCTRKILGTKENPAPNAQAILDAGDSLGSGMYWIQPPGETAPAETYCDMSFAGGGWMLASYGYVHAATINANNKAIPNMNNPFGFVWLPTQRSSSHGLINLPHGAVKMANNARYMIMAAGNNPATGGINEYSYVYRIYLENNPYNITFANHNRYNGGQPSRMHVVDFVVEALKGESGTYVRYALGEALGVTWTDSYPTGYGFNDKNAPNAIFLKGPFFPSVHSGSGRSPCSGCTSTNYEPDVPGGSPHYTHHGWFIANGWDKTGQTSIWFK